MGRPVRLLTRIGSCKERGGCALPSHVNVQGNRKRAAGFISGWLSPQPPPAPCRPTHPPSCLCPSIRFALLLCLLSFISSSFVMFPACFKFYLHPVWCYRYFRSSCEVDWSISMRDCLREIKNTPLIADVAGP